MTTQGTKLTILSGCRALNLPKGAELEIVSTQVMGAEYSHQVKFVVQYGERKLVLWARNRNQVLKPTFHLNNGDPKKRITVA